VGSACNKTLGRLPQSHHSFFSCKKKEKSAASPTSLTDATPTFQKAPAPHSSTGSFGRSRANLLSHLSRSDPELQSRGWRRHVPRGWISRRLGSGAKLGNDSDGVDRVVVSSSSRCRAGAPSILHLPHQARAPPCTERCRRPLAVPRASAIPWRHGGRRRGGSSAAARSGVERATSSNRELRRADDEGWVIGEPGRGRRRAAMKALCFVLIISDNA
jgi:hypothetical protein